MQQVILKNSVLSWWQKAAKIVVRVLIYALLVFGSVLIVFPFLWMLLSSFKTPLDANALDFSFFPKEWVTSNYAELFASANFPIVDAFFNTILVEVSVIVIGTFVSALAAFSFAKLKLQHKTFWLLFLMSGMMVPYAALMLPQFRVFQAINMFDTLWPLILPGFFGNVSMLFFLVQYMRGVPNAILEAARMDGAGHFTCFIRVMFPLVKTAIAAQVIFWQYLPMALAGAVLSSIPMFVIYLSCQKFFIESLAISGVKG